MTEKRFEGEEDSDYIRDNKTDERELYLCDWLDKLNNLSDENEQLKKSIKRQQLSNEECSKYIEEVAKENKQLKEQVEDLYESDKSLRKFASNMTLNYTGICVPRKLFVKVITILKNIEHNDLVEDLSKESVDTSANGCQE